nr:hypothetical protein [Streptococcus oralis]
MTFTPEPDFVGQLKDWL